MKKTIRSSAQTQQTPKLKMPVGNSSVAPSPVIKRPAAKKTGRVRPTVVRNSLAQTGQVPPPQPVQEVVVVSDPRRKLRKKVLNKAMHDALKGVSYTATENQYLQTLVDPERYTGVRYPDQFARKTAVVHTLLNHEVFVFPTDNGVEPAGTYLNVVTPSLTSPLLEYCLLPLETNTNQSKIQMYTNIQSNDWGLFPKSGLASSNGMDSGMLLLNQGEWNLVAPWYAQGPTSASQSFPPMRGEDGDGNPFYGMPLTIESVTSGDTAVTVNIVRETPATSTGTIADITVELVSELGTKSEVVASVTGSTVYTATFTVSDIVGSVFPINNPLYGNTASVGMPGVGVRIYQNRADTWFIKSVEVSVLPRTSRDVPMFRTVDLPDVGTYLSKVDQYRPISASVWMEYEGADLTNGGQASAIMYRGGKPYSTIGLWDYSRIAETPGGYQAALKLGTYSFWLPATVKDTMMREITSRGRWALPFIVNAGLVASPDLEHVLRLRVPMNFEMISSAQFFSYDSALVHPEWIEQAGLITSNIPTSMENPGHFNFIGDLLGGGIDALAGIGKGILGGIF